VNGNTAVPRAAVTGRMQQHLAHTPLLHGSTHVLVAVSGGLDSMVLLHALRFGRTTFPITAAHFDHRMRARSGDDADWVRGVCTAWDVALLREAAQHPPRSEAAARAQRYAFLEAAAARVGADAIATAHHADDQAETILFRLLRGAGLHGLRGIPPRRGRLVRPLLEFTRADAREYARENRLAWREDPSNRDERFARNRIRRRLLPALEAARPGAAGDVVRLGALAEQAENAWCQAVTEAVRDVAESRAEGGFALARGRFLAYPSQIRARVLRHLAGRLGSPLDRAATRVAARFVDRGRGGIMLPGGLRLEREFETLLLHRPDDRGVDVPLRIAAGEGAATFVAGGQRYLARWGPAPWHDAGQSASFDPSSLRFPLELRGWLPGDRIRLAYGGKKLKKLFQERRVPRSLRARLPVLVDADGCVLWAAGITQAHDVPAGGGPGFHIMVTDDDS